MTERISTNTSFPKSKKPCQSRRRNAKKRTPGALMISNPSFNTPLTLRSPALLFGLIAALLLLAIALVLATWIGGGLVHFEPQGMMQLTFPGLIAAGLAALRVGRGLRAGPMARWLLVVHGGWPFAAIGFAWPLGFGIAALVDGETAVLIGSIAPAVAGLFVGAIVGAIAAVATSFACFVPAKSASANPSTDAR